MKKKKWIIAAITGVLVFASHFIYIKNLTAQAGGGEKQEVLVMTQSVKKGEKLKEKMLSVREIPKLFASKREILKSRLMDVLGMNLTVDLSPGQVLMWTDFVKRLKNGENNLANLVEAGKRAVTISVNKSLSMAGMLRPGHRVDILGTFSQLSGGGKSTVTVLQNVTVIAVGADLHGGKNEANSKKAAFDTVTLSVGLEEAELLALASSEGSIDIVLRGPQDLSIIDDIPEKQSKDLLEAKKRNAIYKKKSINAIERLVVDR